MQEILFEIEHRGCPFRKISGNHPDATFWHWCNLKVDFFEAVGKDSTAISSELEQLARIVKAGFEAKASGKSSRVITFGRSHCTCYALLKRMGSEAINAIVEDHGCLPLDPVTYSKGMELRRILTLDDKKVPILFAALSSAGKTRVLERKEVGGLNSREHITVSLSGLFGKLTEKQSSALVDAFRDGYYEVPRKTKVKAMAARRGVPRPTLEEHLHKAESKVMLSIAPYLRLYAASVPPPTPERGQPPSKLVLPASERGRLFEGAGQVEK